MKMGYYLDNFCRSTFWDVNVTWNTDSPDFTPCFENTVLTWVPCAFLWIFVPLEIYYLRHSQTFLIPFNIYNTVKLVLIGLLSALVLIDAIYSSFIWHIYVPALVVSSLIKFLTFLLFICLTYMNIKYGIRSSGILFWFSFLLVLCGAPKYRTEFTNHRDREFWSVLTYLIYYPIAVIVLLLNCFCDARPVITKYHIPKNVCPENYSSYLSKLLFAWFDSLVWKGHRKPLENDDLWGLDYDNTSASIVNEFEKFWSLALKKSKGNPNVQLRVQQGNGELLNNSSVYIFVNLKTVNSNKPASVLNPLYHTFGKTFLFGSVLNVFQVLLTFVGPQLLSAPIDFVNGNEPMWHGYFYAALLFAVSVIQMFFVSQYFHRMYTVGLRIRTALMSIIYKKSLTISNGARRNFTVGEIVNLMSVDAQRFTDLMAYINLLWSTPLQILLAIYFLWQFLGLSVFAGLSVMIVTIPLNGWLAFKSKKLQTKQMEYKDDRVKLINEILSGIKVLKLYAWEHTFEKRVLHIRNNEEKVLLGAAVLNAGTAFIWACTPFLVSLITFAVYVLSSDENILDAKTAFVSLSLFNILRFPLTMLPSIISNMVQTSVSLKRINKFLNSEDLDPNAVSHENRGAPLSVVKGDFSWEGASGYPFLQNINVNIDSGNLVAVVGPVGSGKSSLIAAFLGEMYKLSGSVNTYGSIAYVPQQAWIQNATFRNNITFGEQSKNVSYEDVLSACALIADLEILPAGDKTEIGEKGVNLSGGQKQRISLARAVYFGADIYLLDDPLSAVDSHVGKHIFEHVIGSEGLLKHKTRILVTHNVTFLSRCDFIIVLKDGSISESGTYKELTDKKGDFADFLLTHLKENASESSDEDTNEQKDILEEKTVIESIVRQQSRNSESNSARSLNRQKSTSDADDVLRAKKDPSTVGEKLIETERPETGNIKWAVYVYYIVSVGILLSISSIAMDLGFQGFLVGSNIWLFKWSSDSTTVVNGTQETNKRDLYLAVYGGLGLAQAVALMLGILMQSYGMLAAAKNLHRFMLSRILRAPLRFFDTTPSGRIVNRFGKDINTLDENLPQNVRSWFACFFGVMASLFVISYSTPMFLFVILPISVIYLFIQKFYVATSRQLRRLESVSRSPIYSHFSETMTGAQSIRAYALQKKFITQSEDKIDLGQKIYYFSQTANRWLDIRLEIIGNLIIFFTALFVVLHRGKLSPGLVGLSMSYALQITEWLFWLVRITSEVETDIVAVERVKEYGETPQEADWEIENQTVPDNWPEKGEVKFNDFRVRYRDGLELVLRGLTFSVNGGQKVGIVGRTGAGKSSLTLSLFRIIESAGGSITIDGIDISTLGLHTLRSRITIIPQDPVLFSGTLRLNLDPIGLYSDESIWLALELVHLKTYVSNLKFGLLHEVNEEGENFSVGQRQLICLARALLRKTKVLILDEATAAIDLETDDLIQTTIRNVFKECTILTIAHRLKTILDYDKILVLDKGVMVEYDTPSVLLKAKNSMFYGMAADAGLL